MMAKMFYTLDETKSMLGKTEDEIKQFAREGRLREFRDGPRLMFKADQVDQLKGELSGGVDMGSGDAPSGSGQISLSDADVAKSNSGSGMLKQDSNLVADLGLSGGPSPSKQPSGSGLGAPGGKGVTVFEVDAAHKADASAQTTAGSGSGLHQSAGSSAGSGLQGIGSGSGLLDLTRETDDTSLGHEVYDELSPKRSPAISDSEEMDALAAPRLAAGSPVPPPVYIEQHDAWATAFGALALFGVLIMIFCGFALINANNGYRPELVMQLSGKGGNHNGPLYLGGTVLVGIIFFVIGYFIGKPRGVQADVG